MKVQAMKKKKKKKKKKRRIFKTEPERIQEQLAHFVTDANQQASQLLFVCDNRRRLNSTSAVTTLTTATLESATTATTTATATTFIALIVEIASTATAVIVARHRCTNKQAMSDDAESLSSSGSGAIDDSSDADESNNGDNNEQGEMTDLQLQALEQQLVDNPFDYQLHIVRQAQFHLFFFSHFYFVQ
jgi:hypothetical protein